MVRLLAFNPPLVFCRWPASCTWTLTSGSCCARLEHALAEQARAPAAAFRSRPLARRRCRSPAAGVGGAARGPLPDRGPEGCLLADSSRLGTSEPVPAAASPAAPATAAPSSRDSPSARPRGPSPCTAWPPSPSAWPAACSRLREPLDESGEFYSGAGTLLGEELRAALAGGYGAATRISAGGQRSVTLYSAVPVMPALGSPVRP